MKRNCFLVLSFVVLLFSLGISNAEAQIARGGIKAGIDVADHKVNSDLLKVGNRIGFQVGGVLELNIPFTGFGVETGVYYGNKDYKVDNLAVDATGDIADLEYLMVPISLKQRVSLFGIVGIYFTAGVYGTYGLSGGELTLGGSEYKQKEFQTGMNFGAGVSLIKHFELGMNYRYKFTDTFETGPSNEYMKVGRQTWNVSLAYLF